jgi:deoxyribonuclease-4
VGCHVFVVGGLARALRRAEERDCDAVQIFPSNPRGWAVPDCDPAEEAEWRDAIDAREYASFVHAPYLVNIASRDPVVHERSTTNLEFALARSARLGARGVVVHAGSAGDDDRAVALRRAAETLLRLLDRVDGTDVLVEMTAASGNLLAGTVEQVAELLTACDDHPRVGVCVDTCHLFAAGVDLRRPAGRRRLREELRELGPERVAVVHVNDSRAPVGSRRDRHARVGTGTIGADALGVVIRMPELRHAPLLLETPRDAAEQRADVALVRTLTAARARR